MKLNFDRIKEITLGAERIEQEDKYIKFYRFTKEEETAYRERMECFYERSLFTAGIKLVFKTDSKSLFIKANIPHLCIRKFFSFDVLVNGEYIGSIDNFSDKDMSGEYATVELPIAPCEKDFELGAGEKTVTIYLPYSVIVELEELIIDDGAYVEAVKPNKKLLVYGDSITQGFDILRPSEHHIPRLANSLGTEVFNKAIAGEVFWSGITMYKAEYVPDYIIVSYGSNDWTSETAESFMKNCSEFFANLKQNYPTSKIFVLTPIWRNDTEKITQLGKFEDVENSIVNAVGDMDNVMVISGLDLVPHESKYFGDGALHPNDEGFNLFFENLYFHIKDKLA